MIDLNDDKTKNLLYQFLSRQDKLGPTPRSPWLSEIFALYWMFNRFDADEWIESGSYHGETAIKLRLLSDKPVTTIEYNPDFAEVAKGKLKDIDGIKLLVGDSNVLIHSLIGDKNYGVFIDGPKGMDAALLSIALIGCSKVSFVAVHDMYKSSPGLAVPGRAAIQEFCTFTEGLSFWATDDPLYAPTCKLLDSNPQMYHPEDGRGGWQPFQKIMGDRTVMRMNSYGPTVAFLLKDR